MNSSEENTKRTVTTEELKKIIEEKDKFMSVITHDLRNPVSAIRGFTELLLLRFDTFTEEQKRSFLREVFDSAEKAGLLLHNVRLREKISSSTLSLKNEKINVHKQIKDNLSLYKLTAGLKNIDMMSDVPEDLEIVTDKNIFDTIIRNILSNSLKFTESGGLIHFTAEIKEDTISVIMEDNGQGMDMGDLKNILNPDFNYSTPGTSNESGTGLGLSLCNDLIMLLGGEFIIQSSVGKGSRFIIKLNK